MTDASPLPLLVIRLWPDHHNDPACLEELLALLRRQRACCDEVWFCTELGFPTLDRHAESAARMAAAARRFQAEGILAGIQIANTLGHGDGPFAAEGANWRRMVGPDGRQTPLCFCPRDARLGEYVAALTRLYAAWGPSSIWIDDDLRMNNHSPVVYGCFCADCVGQFGRRQGRQWQAPDLWAAMAASDGGPLRAEWIRFGQESLAQVARTITQAARAVAPACRMGLQHCGHEWGLYNGSDWMPVFRSLDDDKGLSVGSRPGGGFYTDHAPRGMLLKAMETARQIARTAPPVTLVSPEVENFTHTAMGKTPGGTVLESTLNFALGANGMTYAVLCSAHEPTAWYEGILGRIAAWRPFWLAMLADMTGSLPGGLDVAYSRDHAANAARTRRPAAWAQIDLSQAYQLMTLGLPLCPDSPAACASLLHVQAADGLSPAEVGRLLAGGVLMDGAAAARLVERGLGDELGVKLRKVERVVSFEQFTDDPLNGGAAGHVWRQYFTSAEVYELEPTAKSARVMGQYLDPAKRLGAAATVATQTASGGRVVIFGYNGYEPVVSAARRGQILAAADWVSRGRLPAILTTPAQVALVPRVTPEGVCRGVFVLNISIDVTDELTLRVRNWPGRSAVCRYPDRPEAPVQVEENEVEATLRLPPMPAWSCLWLAP